LSVVFFTDRDLGTQFPAILSAAGLRVEKHADHFLAFLADHPPPVIGKVYRASAVDIPKKADAPGRVEIWYPKD
jgi:hypothetical protein